MKTVYNKSLFLYYFRLIFDPVLILDMILSFTEPLEFMRALKAGDFHQVFHC